MCKHPAKEYVTRTAMRIALNSSESNTWNTWFAGKGIRCGHPRIKQSCTRTSIHIIALTCPVRIVFPHRLHPTAWGEWCIPWISCRIFAWFTRAFLSSLNNTIIDRKLLRYYQFQPYMGHKPSYILFTRMISLLLHSTSAPPQSRVITTISSSYWDITNTYLVAIYKTLLHTYIAN